VVFGGSGFVGSHMADALTQAGHAVAIYDRRPSRYLAPGQEMILGDVLDAEHVAAALRGADVVYNFAGLAALDDASSRPVDTVMLNVLGNTVLLDAAAQAGCRRFFYASTIYVYSQKGGFYRCSKQAAEAYIEEYQRRFGLDFTIMRYGTLYGPRADESNSIRRYLTQALRHGRIETTGNGDERREYIHVRDAARLSLELLDPRYANTHVTLSGNQTLRFRDLLFMIREILDNTVEVIFTGEGSGAHYERTPYSYAPKAGFKLISNQSIDLGQGLVECLEELDAPEAAERRCDEA
jgi:UDP-glucose 4-epimerase